MTRTDLIKRAIESAKCRLYKVRVRDSYSIDHQQKAENQTELMNITIEALEKQIPKKPYIQQDERNNDCFECPNCDSFIGFAVDCKDEHYQIPFCPNCGQALDWSEEE